MDKGIYSKSSSEGVSQCEVTICRRVNGSHVSDFQFYYFVTSLKEGANLFLNALLITITRINE